MGEGWRGPDTKNTPSRKKEMGRGIEKNMAGEILDI